MILVWVMLIFCLEADPCDYMINMDWYSSFEDCESALLNRLDPLHQYGECRATFGPKKKAIDDKRQNLDDKPEAKP